jgi:hypothetical protein
VGGDDSFTAVRRSASRLAGWLVTGPLAFLIAGVIDVVEFALRSLLRRN